MSWTNLTHSAKLGANVFYRRLSEQAVSQNLEWRNKSLLSQSPLRRLLRPAGSHQLLFYQFLIPNLISHNIKPSNN